MDNYNTAHPLYRAIAELGKLRKDHAALRDGTQTTRHSGDGVFAFSRIKGTEYVVAVNSADDRKDGGCEHVRRRAPAGRASTAPAASTALSLTVPAQSSVVFKADRPIPTAPAPRITLRPIGRSRPRQAVVTANVTGDPTATVTFAAQVGDGPWKMLGTATSAPYRIHHDLTDLAGKTKMHLQGGGPGQARPDGLGRTRHRGGDAGAGGTAGVRAGALSASRR